MYYIKRDELGLWMFDRHTGSRHYIPDLYYDPVWDVVRKVG